MLLRILICVLFVSFLFSDLEAKILKQKVRNGIEYTIKSSDSIDNVMQAEARLVDGEENDLIASAQIAKDGNLTGWNRLQVWTNIKYTEQYAASSAGELEACLTTGLIAQYWYNTVNTFCASQEETCSNLKKFISDNYNWTVNKIAEEKDTSAYWYQVNLVYLQIKGMYEGYKGWREETEPDISFEDFQLMNLLGDLTDLIEKFKPETGVPNKLIQEGHSSALIKLLPDYKGLLAGHSTSGSYSSMIRIAKKYELHYQISEDNTTEVNSGIITLSGYPGVVHSGDEFYSLSKGFVVQKSSIFNSNKALWKKVKPEEMVFGSVRLMVANRLAHCGKSWSSIFSQYNSGTSNGQYTFINYNRFQEGQPPQQGLLWVLEQLPGSIVAQDQTPHLNATSYWANYNIPYYNDIYKLSGNDKLAKKYGSWFSHSSSPRAKIFKRDHSDISCCCGMMALLRYNNYKHDPLSKCKCRPGGYSASNAIAPRQDLNSAKGRYPIPYFGRHAGGSIDGKVITSQLVQTQQFKAQSGPTIGSLLPPFKWSTSGFDKTVRHLGQIDEWNFGTQLIQWFN